MITKYYGVSKNILVKPESAFARPVNIKNDGLTKDNDGNIIIQAGTFLTSTGDLATDANPVATVTTDSSKAQAIVLNDVEAVNGAYASVLLAGYINVNQMDSNVAKNYTASSIKQLETAMPKLMVVNE